MSNQTKTKERPIIFSGPMVQAILDGRKTQTRRVFKLPKRLRCCSDMTRLIVPHNPGEGAIGDRPYFSAAYCENCDAMGERICAPWQVGDLLWVRETWQEVSDMGICHPSDSYTVYRATDPDWSEYEGWKWRPSIYMPRSASRITLRVTGVRVDRVQDISAADAVAEGCLNLHHLKAVNHYPGVENEYVTPAKEVYAELWNSLNAKHGYDWDSNPEVWANKFERVTP